MKLVAKIARLVEEKVEVPFEVVGEFKDADGGTIFYVTRAEALRLLGEEGFFRDPATRRIRNYELESRLRSWASMPDEGRDGFVITEWCPFNGAWCAWTKYMPPSEVRKLLEDPEVASEAKAYLRRERPDAWAGSPPK